MTPFPQLAEQSLSELALQPAGQHPSAWAQDDTAWWVQATLQLPMLPVLSSRVQGLPSLQLAGQLPSQVSPASMTPFPQLAEQSESLLAEQAAGQQPSPCSQLDTVWWLQATLQLATEPVSASTVQELPSLQLAGQLPSQVSPASMTPFPQLAEQSESVRALQPAGQHPSPSVQVVMDWCTHERLQLAALPVLESAVQALASLQTAGQLPSQVSLTSTTPLPQLAEQSESFAREQPAGQHPSPCLQVVMPW